MATHSSVLAWRIPGTAEPGGLPSLGLHRVGHDWSNSAAAAVSNSKERKYTKLKIKAYRNASSSFYISKEPTSSDIGAKFILSYLFMYLFSSEIAIEPRWQTNVQFLRLQLSQLWLEGWITYLFVYGVWHLLVKKKKMTISSLWYNDDIYKQWNRW